MEALAAVSLASNVAQFLEYGLKAVATTYELLRTPDGKLQENVDLQNIAQSVQSGFGQKLKELRLDSIAEQAATSLEKVADDLKSRDELLSSLDLPLSNSRAAENDLIQDLVSRCLGVAGEILSILNGLNVSGTPRTGVYLKIKVVSKTLWKRSELKELYERLNSLRSQISAHLVVLLL